MDMEAQSYLREVLLTRLNEIKLKNPLYSLRAFSKTTGIHHAALSEFLNGKRSFSKKMADRIVENLALGPDYQEDIDLLYAGKKLRKKTKSNVNRENLEVDQYELVADWHYYTILSLIETKSFQNDPKWIADRIESTPKKVKDTIERLKRLGLVRELKNGKLKVKDIQLDTTDNISNLSLKKRHMENMDAAREAVTKFEVDKRFFSFETLAFDQEKMPEVKELIWEFHDRLVELANTKKKDDVYEVCFSLFPRTK